MNPKFSFKKKNLHWTSLCLSAVFLLLAILTNMYENPPGVKYTKYNTKGNITTGGSALTALQKKQFVKLHEMEKCWQRSSSECKKWLEGRLRGKRGPFEETWERLLHIWLAKQLKWVLSGGKGLDFKIYTWTAR